MTNITTLHLDDVISKFARDMSGKTALITGTTSGTGFVCARELAKCGASVVLLNRSSQRADDALAQLQKAVPSGKFIAITCDLQSFASVNSAINAIKNQFDCIDILCHNAGVMAMKDQATGDGYDIQMQTNCLSHFLLTKELLPLMLKSSQARIVNHTSMARLGDPLEMKYFGKNGGNLGGDGSDEENFRFTGPRWQRYHQTKLANCNFTYGLKRRLDEAGITNVIPLLAHPGLALTGLQATTAKEGGMAPSGDFMNNAQSAEDGALGIIRACFDENSQSGDFYGPQGWTGFPDKLPPEDLLLDEENIRINWQGCEAAVGEFTISKG